jgi:ferredoxin
MPATGHARHAHDPLSCHCRRTHTWLWPRESMSTNLRVNPITCEAHGLCAELLPEMITLDDWGYPIIEGNPVTPELLDHAQRAAAACPTLALLIQRRQPQR